MNWHENIQEGFPPTRDDEPQQLRLDIADEIADHLSCAMQREMRRNDNESAARRAVLDRFGNPRQLARKLWLDAMKERIMKDRIMLAAVVVLAFVGISTSLIGWMSFKQTQQTNVALVAALERLAETSNRGGDSQTPTDLAMAHFTVVSGTPEGKPVEGIELELSGHPFAESRKTGLSETSDPSGVVGFGPIRPGPYSVSFRDLALPGILDLTVYFHRMLTLYGGKTHEERIVLPPFSPAEVSLRIPESDAWRDKQAIAVLEFHISAHPRELPDDNLSGRTGLTGVDAEGNLYDLGYSEKRLIRHNRPVQILSLLPTDYMLYYFRLGLAPTVHEDNAVFYEHSSRHEYESPPTYTAVAGQENVWEIEIPEPLIRKLLLPEGLDPDIADAIDGRIMKVFPVAKDCEVRKVGLGTDRDDISNLAVYNWREGVRTLLGFPRIPSNAVSNPHSRILLALFAKTGHIQPTAGTVQVHEVSADWPEEHPLRDSPKVLPSAVAEIESVEEVGWKILDVTSLVRKWAESGQAGHGIMLRYEREDYPPKDGSGYEFVSREAEGDFADKRPVLLVVE